MTAKKQRKPRTGAEGVRWDLSELYASDDDPAIERDLRKVERLAKLFGKRFRGKVRKRLGACITAWNQISEIEDKPLTYFFNRISADPDDNVIRQRSDAARKRIIDAYTQHMSFFFVDAAQMSMAEVRKIAERDPVVKHHLPTMDGIIYDRPHMFSSKVEAMLFRRSFYAGDAWATSYDRKFSQLEFPWKGKHIPFEEIRRVAEQSKSGRVRALANKTMNTHLHDMFVEDAAEALNNLYGEKAIDDLERKYEHPMETANRLNGMSLDEVDALFRAVQEEMPAYIRRFYQLRARLLKKPVLAWSDRRAPLPFEQSSIVPWAHATRLVIDTFERLSPVMGEVARDVVEMRRVDAEPRLKKDRGAYAICHTSHQGGRPLAYVFLHYHGLLSDVMYLAHELGHTTQMVRSAFFQGPLLWSAPPGYAEVPSMFGEHIVFEALREAAFVERDWRNILVLLFAKIDEVMYAIPRQIVIANVERQANGFDLATNKWGPRKTYTPREFCTMWEKSRAQLFGEAGDLFTYEHSDAEWAITNLTMNYYPYSYPASALMVNEIFLKHATMDAAAWEKAYLRILDTGERYVFSDLFLPFGINVADRPLQFWRNAIHRLFGPLLDQVEQIAHEAGYIK